MKTDKVCKKENNKNSAAACPVAGVTEFLCNADSDSNVDADGHCILAQEAEMARPNSGAPCDEGLDGGLDGK